MGAPSTFHVILARALSNGFAAHDHERKRSTNITQWIRLDTVDRFPHSRCVFTSVSFNCILYQYFGVFREG